MLATTLTLVNVEQLNNFCHCPIFPDQLLRDSLYRYMKRFGITSENQTADQD